MRIAEILAQPTGYDRIRYPSIAHIAVDADWAGEFEVVISEQPRIKILAREQAGDVTILRIGCASNAIRRKLLGLFDLDCRSNF